MRTPGFAALHTTNRALQEQQRFASDIEQQLRLLGARIPAMSITVDCLGGDRHEVLRGWGYTEAYIFGTDLYVTLSPPVGLAAGINVTVHSPAPAQSFGGVMHDEQTVRIGGGGGFDLSTTAARITVGVWR